jgi:flagellar basal-body rod protein FlgB
MPIKSLFGKTYEVIERSLDITKLRHGLIGSNVANLDTPGYRSKEIDFDKTLKDAVERRSVEVVRTHPIHIRAQGAPHRISIETSGWVDIDKEMSKLAENNLRYQTGIEMLIRKFSKLKYTITEGGR